MLYGGNGNKSPITNGKKIQLENENKRPFENWTEKSLKITKIKKWWIRKHKIQLENVNKNPT